MDLITLIDLVFSRSLLALVRGYLGGPFVASGTVVRLP